MGQYRSDFRFGGIKMYIEKYWENYIGGTDDSMTLLDYLADKHKEEISFSEIISDTGLDKLSSFQKTEVPLSVLVDGMEAEIYYAIDLITDLAALMLECKVNGSVNLCDLSEIYEADCVVCITATPREHAFMNKALMDFVAAPLSYDLSEMVPEEDMLEMAGICEELRKELYE